jgi:uncharacterized protein YPO0396
MSEPTLTGRVEILEQKVENLEKLPARVEAVELQIVQLRDEMRGEFSAVRAEMRGMGTDLRSEMHALGETLRIEIRQGDEETRRQMRMLHEEVIARIEILGGPRRNRKKK